MATLKKLTPWFFLLDHTHYARWLPVHLRDLEELPLRHPDVHKNFSEGKFVAYKTGKSFSGIALDHAHEQLNATVKGDGGIIGITDNANALQRWSVAGPEVSSLIEAFETKCLVINKSDEDKHHELTPSQQRHFLSAASSLVDKIEEYGNRFEETSNDLIVLDS